MTENTNERMAAAEPPRLMIRLAEADDLPSLLVFANTFRLPHPYRGKGKASAESNLIKSVLPKLALRRLWPAMACATRMLALDDGIIIGQAVLTPPRLENTERMATLSIKVSEDCRGRGVGTALLAALLAQADTCLKLDRVTLSVRSDNHHALYLYRKFDFQRVSAAPHRALPERADGMCVEIEEWVRIRPQNPAESLVASRAE